METFKMLLDYIGILFPILMLIFLKKDLHNSLALVLLVGIFLFQRQIQEFEFYILLLVISLVLPQSGQKNLEIITRFISAISLSTFLILNLGDESFENTNYFLTLCLAVFVLTKGTSRKLLSIATICMPLIGLNISASLHVLLCIPFLLLPFLNEKVSKRDFQVYSLGCLVIIGGFSSELLLSTCIGFIVIASYILNLVKGYPALGAFK